MADKLFFGENKRCESLLDKYVAVRSGAVRKLPKGAENFDAFFTRTASTNNDSLFLSVGFLSLPFSPNNGREQNWYLHWKK
jgi:hypothetical protein